MTQPRRSTGPRIQKVSQKRESAPDSSAMGTLLKENNEDATLCRRAPESDPRTLIGKPVDSEPRTLIAKESCDSDPRTLIARDLGTNEEAPIGKGGSDEGPATVLWTRASVEVRVRGLVTPSEGTPIPAPEPMRTKVSASDKAKPVAKVSVRPSAQSSAPPAARPSTPASFAVPPPPPPRNTPPSFLPKAAASVMPQPVPSTRVNTPAPMSPRPAPVPSTFPLAQSRASTPPPSGLTPMQKLMMQRAQQIHEAQQAAKIQSPTSSQPPMSHPMSRPPMSQPMSQQPMSQQPMSQHPMSQHPMSQHPMSQPVAPYSVHPQMPVSQMPRPSQMPQHLGSISPVAMDPSGVNTSFAPTVHLREKSEVGSTIAKLAAVLVFAAIGLFILRGSVGGTVAPETAQQPAAQPVPVLTMQAPQAPPPNQPMAIPSAWMAPTATVIPPGMINDPNAPAPQTVATTTAPPVKKKTTKKRVEPAANPTPAAPAPAPVDLPGETPEPTPAAAPVPVPAPAPAPVPATGGSSGSGQMKNMPTKTAAPTKTEGDAAQKTLDQAKFETTDAL